MRRPCWHHVVGQNSLSSNRTTQGRATDVILCVMLVINGRFEAFCGSASRLKPQVFVSQVSVTCPASSLGTHLHVTRLQGILALRGGQARVAEVAHSSFSSRREYGIEEAEESMLPPDAGRLVSCSTAWDPGFKRGF